MLNNNSSSDGEKVRLGITHGDINGINYEIIIKAFSDPRIFEFVVPLLYGSSKIISYYRKTLKLGDFVFNLTRNAGQLNSEKFNILNVVDREVKVEIGKSTEAAGKLSFNALKRAVDDIKGKKIEAIVTAPINKYNISGADFRFPGHTEYFADQFNASNHLMLMVSNDLRIGIATGHIPLRDISEKLNKKLILDKIITLDHSLKRDFQISKPKIAVLGLNPHAGEEGLIGNEEQEIIIPAINEAEKNDITVFGPYPADGFFGSSNFMNFDGILAMYHDQGMLAFKSHAFDSGVNFTAGLPIVRTSPAHGTAYDLAGKNEASEESFREAVFLARKIFLNRKAYDEENENPLPFYLSEKEKEENSR